MNTPTGEHEHPEDPAPPEPGWFADPINDLIDTLYYLASSAHDAMAATGTRPRWVEAMEAAKRLYRLHKARDEEEYCHRCGRAYTPWSAMSPLWNEVMRGGHIGNGPEPFRGMVCCDCFIKLAEEAGVATGWRLHAGQVFRTLQTRTPDGRTWNAETWLFETRAADAGTGTDEGVSQLVNIPRGSAMVGGRLIQVSHVGGDVNL